MPSIRQKLSAIRRESAAALIRSTPFSVQNIRLESRDPDTGNWAATTANGSRVEVLKRGLNSAQGLEIPGITVEKGLGRFAN